jgi:hypothetical protein
MAEFDEVGLKVASDFLKDHGFEAAGEWMLDKVMADSFRPAVFAGESIDEIVEALAEIYYQGYASTREGRHSHSAGIGAYLAGWIGRGTGPRPAIFPVPIGIEARGPWGLIELSDKSRDRPSLMMICPSCRPHTVWQVAGTSRGVRSFRMDAISLTVMGDRLPALFVGRCPSCSTLYLG